jgi:hypothetical protein
MLKEGGAVSGGVSRIDFVKQTLCKSVGLDDPLEQISPQLRSTSLLSTGEYLSVSLVVSISLFSCTLSLSLMQHAQKAV